MEPAPKPRWNFFVRLKHRTNGRTSEDAEESPRDGNERKVIMRKAFTFPPEPLEAMRRKFMTEATKRTSQRRNATGLEEQMKRKIVTLHKQNVPRGMLLSNSKFRISWDLFSIILIMYITVQTPFIVAFSVEVTSPALLAFDLFVAVFFMADIALNFRTGFFDGQRTAEETNPRKVAWNYLKGWFVMDVIATVPWGELGLGGEHSKVFRLTKLARLFKIPLFLETLDNQMSISKAGVTIGFLIVAIVCMAHWAACLFFLVSVISIDTDGDEAEARLPQWMPEHVTVDAIWRQYVNAFYWSVSTLTTVGYGDVTPKSDVERGAATFVMLMGGSFYGYGIASMAQLVSKLDLNKQNCENKMDQVKAYMASRNLPRDLQLRVKQYYKYYMSQKTAMNEKQVLGELSTLLRNEVAGHLVNHIVYEVPIFMGQDPHIISQLVHIIKPCAASPGDTIIQAGESGRDMYMIISGKLLVHSPKGEFLHSLVGGDSFGELSALGVTNKRLTTIRAETYCEMLSLARDDLMDAFSKSPEAIEAMKELARENRQYKLSRAKKKLNVSRLMGSRRSTQGGGSPEPPSRPSFKNGLLQTASGSLSNIKVAASAHTENEGPAEQSAIEKNLQDLEDRADPDPNILQLVERPLDNGAKGMLSSGGSALKIDNKSILRNTMGSYSSEEALSTPSKRTQSHPNPNTQTWRPTVSSPLVSASLSPKSVRSESPANLQDDQISEYDQAVAEMVQGIADRRRRESLVVEKLELLEKHNAVLRAQLFHLGKDPRDY
jgi:voltage-gated potassium channel